MGAIWRMTWKITSARMASEDRNQPQHDQQEQNQHDRDQDLHASHRRTGETVHPQKARNGGNDQKNEDPFDHLRCPFLQPCSPTSVAERSSLRHWKINIGSCRRAPMALTSCVSLRSST